MLKITIFVLMFTLSAFSYELVFSKKFSNNVSGDLLSTYINISIENKKEKEVNKKMELFNSYIKEDTKVSKKNGSYTVSPKYKYYNNRQEFIGYSGSLRYSIEAINAKKLNEFLDKLFVIKEQFSDKRVKLNISNIKWIISKKSYEENYDKLRIDSILWLENYSKTLAVKINKSCEIKKININAVRQNYRRYEMAVNDAYMSKSLASTPTPSNSEQEISINPNFVLECK